MYLIEQLDGLITFMMAACVISVLISLGTALYEAFDEEGMDIIRTRKIRKTSVVIALISAALLVVTPSTSQAYRIIGIGGTIDYLRQNETAKQLPDKCIEAVDHFLNKIKEEEK